MPKIDVTKLPVVLTLPEMEKVEISREVEYSRGTDGPLGMDIYYPLSRPSSGVKPGVVILVTGHADPVIEAAVGCKLKDSEAYISWAKLIAVSGFVAITYSNQNPAEDIVSLVSHLQKNADALGIDESRVGIWSCSANVPNALSLLMSQQASIRCAAFLYGFMLDCGGRTFVADAAEVSGFAAPNADKSIDDVPADIPLLIVRAGADEMPGINQSIDDFCAEALSRNLPVTLVNLPNAPHSFDLFDDSELTKTTLQEVLAFFVFNLSEGE